jgi:flagella basal body P-ring formation protein FlgA
MRSAFLRLLSVLLLLSGAATMLRAQSVVPTTASGTPPRGVARVTVGVATRALARGETLTAADIAVVDTTMVWRWNTVAPDTVRAVPGWVTHRAIAQGEVLRAPAVQPPAAIATGAAITAIYRDGPLQLVLTGIATNSAAIGAPVGIRIDRSRRLDGIAVGPNLVRLR